MNSRRQQSGIALIFVLMISAVLSVIMLFMAHTAKQNIALASSLQDKTAAIVALHDAESALLFDLLTKPLNNLENEQLKWNFFGEPFSYSGQVRIQVQDITGLLNLNDVDQQALTRFLNGLGITGADARSAVAAIEDWQDNDNDVRRGGAERGTYNFGPRNAPIPETAELNWITSIPLEHRQTLIDNSTIINGSHFNPMNAPVPVLRALMDDDQASNGVIDARRTAPITDWRFSQISGINPDEGVFFFTSDLLRITLTSRSGVARASKRVEIKLSPHSEGLADPVQVVSQQWFGVQHLPSQ